MAITISKFHADILPDEGDVLRRLITEAGLDANEREAISSHAVDLVNAIRTAARPGIMESFLAEYGLSTEEGVALMCLAEALWQGAGRQQHSRSWHVENRGETAGGTGNPQGGRASNARNGAAVCAGGNH